MKRTPFKVRSLTISSSILLPTYRIKTTSLLQYRQLHQFPDIKSVDTKDIFGFSNFNKENYFVERTKSGNLPVYLETKGGGTKLITVILKISGNIINLRNELQECLPNIERDKWSVVMQSKKIILKGNHISEVKKVLSKTF